MAIIDSSSLFDEYVTLSRIELNPEKVRLLNWYINEWDLTDDLDDLKYEVEEICTWDKSVDISLRCVEFESEEIPEKLSIELDDFCENLVNSLLYYAENQLEDVSEDEGISYEEILKNY